jgi:hypothetical protein
MLQVSAPPPTGSVAHPPKHSDKTSYMVYKSQRCRLRMLSLLDGFAVLTATFLYPLFFKKPKHWTRSIELPATLSQQLASTTHPIFKSVNNESFLPLF